MYLSSLMGRRNTKKSNFDMVPEHFSGGMFNTGTLGAVMSHYAASGSGQSPSSKLIVRLLVTNLPSEYQDVVCFPGCFVTLRN